MSTIVIAGKAKVTVISPEHEKPLVIGNNQDGASQIKEFGLSNSMAVSFVGNKRWITPMAAYLHHEGIQVFYIPTGMERGTRGFQGKMIEMLVKNAFPKRPFFAEKKAPLQFELPTPVRLVHEYLEVCDKVRALKHHVLDRLTLLFPEAVKSKDKDAPKIDGLPDIFTKKMLPVLENPDPLYWKDDREFGVEIIRTLASQSLSQFLPTNTKDAELAMYKKELEALREWGKTKIIRIKAIREIVPSSSATKEFNDGEIIACVVALLGWRKWQNWRELRKYCGLDVTRFDGKKARISRVRGEIRQYLYLLGTLTKRGRVIFAEVPKERIDEKGETVKVRHRTVKKVERLLKFLWREYLSKEQLIEA